MSPATGIDLSKLSPNQLAGLACCNCGWAAYACGEMEAIHRRVPDTDRPITLFRCSPTCKHLEVSDVDA